MFLDARGLPRRAEPLRCDVCIVGAGAAGITLARELAKSALSVCVLESGGLTADAATQALNEGPARGTALSGSDDYLRRSRLRYFGGTTNHWFGWCRPLDALDLAPRPWVPDSGWPLRRDDLDADYRRAAELVQVPAAVYSGSRAAPDLLPEASGVETTRFFLSPPTRFGLRYRADLARSDRVRVLLHATALEIQTHPDGRQVTRVRAGTLTGRRFAVEARSFVLATGGVENARLLLASNATRPAGIGNEHDLVGRYFSEHPHVENAGELWIQTDESTLRSFDVSRQLRHGTRQVGFLRLSDRLQREQGLLNVGLQVAAHRETLEPEPASTSAAEVEGSKLVGVAIDVRAEAAPNPESRVTLAAQRDALGMQRASLDWKLTRDDIESIRRTLEQLGRALGARGLGRVRVGDLSAVKPGEHHMGTTRMSGSPRTGVVDPHGRVHGVSNLHIAGSSVFPTVGFSNPTLTLLALTLRLADRLRTV